MRFNRAVVAGATVLSLALVAGGCGSSGGNDNNKTATKSGAKKGSLTVASFNFSESTILANAYATALESKGYKVTLRASLGNREVVEPALEKGDIDLYPGYAATELEFLNNSAGEATPDAAATVKKLNTRLAAKNLVALEPSEAIDTNAFAVTKSTADKLKLKKLSDLAGPATNLTLGGPPECPARPFCQKGLEDKYGIKFKDFKPVGLGATANDALANGNVDVALVLSTDGLARDKGFVLLDDDKKLQNADNVVPVIRKAKATSDVRSVLNDVSSKFTTDDLAQLNLKADRDKEDPEVLGKQWAKDNGF